MLHVSILLEKIADTYFFHVWFISHSSSYAPFDQNIIAILLARYLKKYLSYSEWVLLCGLLICDVRGVENLIKFLFDSIKMSYPPF